MAIWLNEGSNVIVQGMTGSEGTKHTGRMLASGANVVGGVNARKAGTSVDFSGTTLPVFGTVAEAMQEHGNPAQYLITSRYIESLRDMTKSNNAKVIFMPVETSSMLASVGAIKEMISETGGKSSDDQPPPPPRQLR